MHLFRKCILINFIKIEQISYTFIFLFHIYGAVVKSIITILRWKVSSEMPQNNRINCMFMFIFYCKMIHALYVHGASIQVINVILHILHKLLGSTHSNQAYMNYCQISYAFIHIITGKNFQKHELKNSRQTWWVLYQSFKRTIVLRTKLRKCIFFVLISWVCIYK